VKLRLQFYLAAGAVAFICCGCFSVELQTRVNRKGGGTRTVGIVMDPVMAGMYNRTAGSDKLFKIPGQGLLEKPGVQLTGEAKTELDDGSLKLTRNYRTGRMELFSDGNDSIRFKITRSGLWVYYEYLESISASKPEPGSPDSGQDIYRIRHELFMPGQIVSHNSDSAQFGSLIWNRPLGQVTASGLAMKAISRELNPLYLLFAAVLLAAGGGCLYWYKVRPANIS